MPARAYYTLRLPVFFLRIALTSVLLLTSYSRFFCTTSSFQPPEFPVPHVHFDFLTSPALSLYSHRQFLGASLLSVCRAHAPRPRSFTIPSRHPTPRRSFVTTLLSLLILIDGTSRSSPPAGLVVFFYFAVRIICPDAPCSLASSRGCSSPRPLHSPLFATLSQLVTSQPPSVFPSISLSLQLLSLGLFPYPHGRVFALDTARDTPAVPIHFQPVAPCRSHRALFHCSD